VAICEPGGQTAKEEASDRECSPLVGKSLESMNELMMGFGRRSTVYAEE